MSKFRVTTPTADYEIFARSAMDAAWRIYRRLFCRVPMDEIKAYRI